MTIIKRIIDWLISLFKKLFKKEKKDKTSLIKGMKKKNKNKKNNIKLDAYFDEELPSYMIIDDHEKEMLLYSISLIKSFLEENNTKRKEIYEKEIIKLLADKHNIKTKEITNEKNLELIIKDLDTESKQEVYDKFDNIVKCDDGLKVSLKEIDKVIDKISNEDISIIEENEIDREISNVVNDKNIQDNMEEKVDFFNKNVFDIIENIDEDFIKNVVTEYQKVNYVTVSTMIIDKNYERFKKLEEDFKHHRFNKFYYEREVTKLKHELRQIKNLKNKKEVSEHLDKLKKELFTKSKDKYDLLYNNEIFVNFDKECDLLLDKINVKVVDIKKEEVKEEPKQEEDIKNKVKIENILLRFKDCELARKFILYTQEEDNELIKENLDFFIERMYKKFNEGILLNYNFERNKKKTELVVLYNELNMAINKKNDEPYINLDHINFKMDDLVEAVEVKKTLLNKLVNNDLSDENIKATEKINSLTEKQNIKIKKT